MPELPEVETIANGLRQGGEGQPSILGKTICRAHLLWPRTLDRPAPEEFLRRVTGQRIEHIGRRAKYLLFGLSSAETMLVHLRMSGDMRVEPSEQPPAAHHRLMLDLDDGWRLAFNDTRKFGRVWLVADPEEITGSLGPEPFDPALTPAVFYARLNGARRALKPLLLDQHFLAGVGNIYADESLHRAGLHPTARAHRLSPAQAERLLTAIRSALQEGISNHGASIDWVYRGGGFQNHFRVYDQTGKPCPDCGAPVEKMVLGQRSTHFCPRCQPLQEAG